MRVQLLCHKGFVGDVMLVLLFSLSWGLVGFVMESVWFCHEGLLVLS